MEELDREGQRLLQCIRSSDGFSGKNCISGSADFQSLVPKVIQPMLNAGIVTSSFMNCEMAPDGSCHINPPLCQVASLLDKLHSTRQHLHQMWHVRKLKLDQCFQLRLFEQDAEKVTVTDT